MGVNESFEDLAQRAIQHAMAYRKERDTLPPRPTASVQELTSLFDVGVPEVGRDGVEVLDSLAAAADPGLVGNISPNFFAWVMGASHPVGVAAEWMVIAWGQNAAIYDTAPAAAVAEDVVSGWLLQLLALPRGSSVGFSNGATMASCICLAAARSEVLRRFDFDLERQGIFAAPEIKVFAGWSVIQALGRSGIEEMISRHCNGARYLLEQLAAEAGITVINDVVLNQLAIVFGEDEPLLERNRLTDAVIKELARENTSYVTGAEWQGQKILRVSIIS